MSDITEEPQVERPTATMRAFAERWLRANGLSVHYAEALTGEMLRAWEIGLCTGKIQLSHARLGLVTTSAPSPKGEP